MCSGEWVESLPLRGCTMMASEQPNYVLGSCPDGNIHRGTLLWTSSGTSISKVNLFIDHQYDACIHKCGKYYQVLHISRSNVAIKSLGMLSSVKGVRSLAMNLQFALLWRLCRYT
eukprot:898618-Pelagomonas_calceolata.AAC.1